MRTLETWGFAPFENMAAHDFSYHVAVGSTKPELLFAAVVKEIDDCYGCQQVVAIAELFSAARGQMTLESSPLLERWLEDNGKFMPGEKSVQDVRDRLAAIRDKSPLRTHWGKRRRLKPWLASLQQSIDRLESKPTGKKKAKSLTKGKLKLILGKPWPKHAQGQSGYFPDGDGGKVCLTFTDPADAIEMTRSRHVTDLLVNLERKEDAARMLVPIKLMLRGWWDRLESVQFETGTKQWNTSILQKCTEELVNLPRLGRFETDCFTFDDDVVKGVTSNRNLYGISIWRAENVTNRAVDYWSRCKKLTYVDCYGCPKVTSRKLAAYASKNPKIIVGYSGLWV